MLQITIPETELFDSEANLFIQVKQQTLTLEHSLISLSKWESKWHKQFLDKKPKSGEEMLDYVRCMTVTPNVDPNVYRCLTADHIEQINNYIADPMTATWFSEEANRRHSREVITSEIIYYWMISLGIYPECQKWHLNRLLTLIRVCSEKNKPPKQMSKGDILRNQALLNAQRKAKHHTRG